MSSDPVCNHTSDETNRTPATQSFDFVNCLYDYRPNWTPPSPITSKNTCSCSKYPPTHPILSPPILDLVDSRVNWCFFLCSLKTPIMKV